jgi:ketosteroid isomerase-like protein
MFMNAQDNKKLVIEGYRLFQAGDIRALLDRYHDNAEWVGPESEHLPYAGSYHGKQGIAQFFANLDSTAQALQFEPQQFIAEGDKVVVTGISTWLAKSTGRTYDSPWVHVFTIRDNKVAHFHAYWDTAPAERALSPSLPAGPELGKHLHH